ncbi:MAG: HlyD family efflux transporter periplasmic adaptor subunit [Fimbriiglobus sp.]|jgi:HlyD family secretion protein|nr:HlyD family efflux transporter periplasmic adaptor subunit [Fimbriiglobus sp.]
MPRPGKINLGLILSLLLNAGLVAGVAYLVFGPKPTPTSTGGGTPAPLELPAAGDVSALGRVQPAGGLIGVFGPPGDRIVKFEKSLGERVSAGTKLATLSGEDEREAQVKALEAQIAEAKALRASIEASKAAKLTELDAEVNQAKVSSEQDAVALDAKLKAVDAQRKRAKATADRLRSAQASGAKVAAQELEEADAAVAAADAEREATLAQQQKLKAVREEGQKSAEAKRKTIDAETQRALAQVPLATLEANLKAANQKLDSGRLLAPTAGSVVRFLSKQGDTVTTQPVLQLADTGRVVVIAEVYETDVGRVRQWLTAGKPVKAEVDMRVLSDGRKLAGVVADVTKVSTVVAKNVLTPLGPREDADRRVVEVEVELDAAAAGIAKDYLGLQVRVRLFTPVK